jgi:hypothetical protein
MADDLHSELLTTGKRPFIELKLMVSPNFAEADILLIFVSGRRKMQRFEVTFLKLPFKTILYGCYSQVYLDP